VPEGEDGGPDGDVHHVVVEQDLDQSPEGPKANLASEGKCWRWISVNLEYLLYIGFDYDLQLTRH
jgi:hypothetical protein